MSSNSLCKDATYILLDNCTAETRKLAITTCKQILHSTNHMKCVTKYACDPMEIYVVSICVCVCVCERERERERERLWVCEWGEIALVSLRPCATNVEEFFAVLGLS